MPRSRRNHAVSLGRRDVQLGDPGHPGAMTTLKRSAHDEATAGDAGILCPTGRRAEYALRRPQGVLPFFCSRKRISCNMSCPQPQCAVAYPARGATMLPDPTLKIGSAILFRARSPPLCALATPNTKEEATSLQDKPRRCVSPLRRYVYRTGNTRKPGDSRRCSSAWRSGGCTGDVI